MKIDFGEIHGLIGKNGAEKSTLMKTITGLEKQDLGLIYYYQYILCKSICKLYCLKVMNFDI